MTDRPSRKSRFLSPAWLMFGSALLCVVLVPVVHAALQYSSEKTERYRQLSEMTKSERLKVEHAFAEFQKLSPAEQESFRELDRQLEDEQIALKSTLSDYQEFLSALSPVDRAELDRATTKRARLNAIERIQDERAERQRQLDMGYSMVEEFRSNKSWKRPEVFSSEEMSAFVELIEPHLPKASREKMKLDTQQGTVKFALVMAAALDARGRVYPPTKQGLFEEDLLDDLLAAVNNEKIRESFEHHPRKDLKFLEVSQWTVMIEHWKSTPDTSVLYKFLETRDPKEKEELMDKDPKRMYFDLARRYAEKNPSDLSLALELMRKEASPFFERIRGRSGGGRGPGGNGPDRRGGPDGERPPSGEQGEFNGPRREPGPGEQRRFGERPGPDSETPPAGAE